MISTRRDLFKNVGTVGALGAFATLTLPSLDFTVKAEPIKIIQKDEIQKEESVTYPSGFIFNDVELMNRVEEAKEQILKTKIYSGVCPFTFVSWEVDLNQPKFEPLFMMKNLGENRDIPTPVYGFTVFDGGPSQYGGFMYQHVAAFGAVRKTYKDNSHIVVTTNLLGRTVNDMRESLGQSFHVSVHRGVGLV